MKLIDSRKLLLATLAYSALAVTGTAAMATGMQPETSVIILDEADGETTINVKNTDGTAALLYSTIENIPEDTEALVIHTPPVARVEAGETQLVRFLRQGGAPSTTQRLKRVIFEGITQRPNATGNAMVGVTIRQNLPLIIHPKGLERNREPWKLMKWHIKDGKLMVINESPYVVRMAAEVKLQPSGNTATLPRSYVLPGETLSASTDKPASGNMVTISPATVYGFSTDKYDAPIVDATP
ncbi:fimbria/pilus chaperone family protein [Burkholderia cenocepacia]|uniref:fimbria/pilus chaperone family protein n=1 Tax=Burkholderia cenocepacia TaxID=95486 RepID=UPI0028659B29|nr:fimbria/pilus chaperone family protein [Burkholderia cenocepacia]MDR8047986.1 fimbria/pilus periplasmic chaperone [Burkholderia cenocepacia]